MLSALILDHREIAHVLLDAGANPNAFDDRQVAPLQMAITTSGDHALVERLLEAGADPNTGAEHGSATIFSPLVAAANTDDLELAQLLIDHGANINGTPNDQTGTTTPLYTASAHASIEMVELLLDNGADPNRGPTGLGYGPLYGAVLFDRPDVVRLLLDAGADPSTAAPQGLSPSNFTGNEEIIRLLS